MVKKQFIADRKQGSAGQNIPLNFQKYTQWLKPTLRLTWHLPVPKPLTAQAAGRGTVGVGAFIVLPAQGGRPAAPQQEVAGHNSPSKQYLWPMVCRCVLCPHHLQDIFKVDWASGADRAVKKEELLTVQKCYSMWMWRDTKDFCKVCLPVCPGEAFSTTDEQPNVGKNLSPMHSNAPIAVSVKSDEYRVQMKPLGEIKLLVMT